jgi:predicted lactoylglutathione lyase
MQQMVFINVPVKDVTVATDFYLGLGYTKNEMFSDESTSSIMVSEAIVIMLLQDEKFKTFVTKPLGDSETHAFAAFALSAGSREEVNTLVEKALATGGTPNTDPIDMGFMYNRSFHDPDGHLIELVWMDPNATM